MTLTRPITTSWAMVCLVCLVSLGNTRAQGQEIFVYRPLAEISTFIELPTIESPTTITTYYAPSSGAWPTTTRYAPIVTPSVAYFNPPAVASQVISYDAPSPSVVFRAPLATTTYYAPNLVNSTPVVVPVAPVYVAPRYVPGQPVRNVLRAWAP